MVSAGVRRLSRDASHHQRTEAARIACGKDAVGRQHDQRKSAFNAAQRIGHGVGQRLLARARNQMHDDFGVAGGLEDGALLLQLRRALPCAFVMLPLCASAILPLLHSTMMGCALSSAESPAVEYRVCPMASEPGSCASTSAVKMSETSPMDFVQFESARRWTPRCRPIPVRDVAARTGSGRRAWRLRDGRRWPPRHILRAACRMESASLT